MFLNLLKSFFLKKIIKKNLNNHNVVENEARIENFGIIVDTRNFDDIQALIDKLKSKNTSIKDVYVINYVARNNKEADCFSINDIDWDGKIKNVDLQSFIDRPFDLLISYYDDAIGPLEYVTFLSKAKFKVGFTNVNQNLNQLMIKADIKDYATFVDELLKYLKILKKI